jgi:hypothetical protein
MSRIIVLRWQSETPRVDETLFRALELLPVPSRYAVNDYVNINGEPIIMSALAGGRRSWPSTKELLIEHGLILKASIASIVIELHDDPLIERAGLTFHDHGPKRVV